MLGNNTRNGFGIFRSNKNDGTDFKHLRDYTNAEFGSSIEGYGTYKGIFNGIYSNDNVNVSTGLKSTFDTATYYTRDEFPSPED